MKLGTGFVLFQFESRIWVSQNSETLSRILEMASVWENGICPQDGDPSPPRQAEMWWEQGWLERGVVPSVECRGGLGDVAGARCLPLSF